MKLRQEVKLFPHQEMAVNFHSEHHYSINGFEQGLGKTLIGISLACKFGGFTVVVTPAFLKYNWKSDIEEFTEGAKVVIVNKDSDIQLAMTANVAIVNYERLASCKCLFEKASLVIADEAHYLKSMKSNRTQVFHIFVEKFKPERLYLLTGTPVKNNVEEFYSLLKLMSYTKEKTNGKSITDRFVSAYNFARHFSNERSYRIKVKNRQVQIRKFEGLRNETELRSYFTGKYIRRTTAEVMDLPELRDKVVLVDYGRKDTDLKEAFENFRGKVDGHISTVKAKSALSKAKFTAEYALNLYRESGKPVVIFSDHREPVDAIASELKGSEIINGSVSMEKRHEIVKRFQAGEIPFLVATIGSASVGITLTASNNLIFNDLSWVPADNAQALKRIHRIGQNFSCHIHYMAGSYVDRTIIKTLKAKMDVISKIV